MEEDKDAGSCVTVVVVSADELPSSDHCNLALYVLLFLSHFSLSPLIPFGAATNSVQILERDMN